MIELNHGIQAVDLVPKIERAWERSAEKITLIERTFDPAEGAPVYTVSGRYTTRGWTEWTQGFQVGSAILQFDATDDSAFLEMGRKATASTMPVHLTHFGVHDHGFQNVSTFGNLRRLMLEGRVAENEWERAFYELALKVSGAVQARRWTAIDGGGFIYSFNGPHSLFPDTIRSLRALAVAHSLGQVLKIENKEAVSLIERLVLHAAATAKYNVYYGEGRDGYDVRGRVVHESIFNIETGRYRCPSTQQGYSPFSTWTRGQAWIISGFAEQLEYLDILPDEELEAFGGRGAIETMMAEAAIAASDHFIDETPACGVPYWDTAAPGLRDLGDYRNRAADPYNGVEPVDSSAAAISAQGLLRLGRWLNNRSSGSGLRYRHAGIKIMNTLLEAPYLSDDVRHQGLLLHAVYHWPNRWDHVPEGAGVAAGESCMWGDYHLREAMLYLQRISSGDPYLTFFGAV